ncbi:MAG: ABC transporter ATP-binding protein [Lachnospiraceae bacterium]|nr:ABC transporter ATP-binding protein [Lachnospiraceae bacterium]MBR5993935.1 ABC transporter ATP-binding protein [Lachnospiraceae bacterium]
MFPPFFCAKKRSKYLFGDNLGGIFIKTRNTKTKFKLKYYIKKYAVHYICAVLALVLSVSLDMLSPQIILHLVDDVILGGDNRYVNLLLAGILLIGVGRFIFQYIKEYIFDYVSVNIACHLRRDLFVHVEHLDTAFFDKNNTGEIMARVKDDIDRIWDALSYVSMLIIEVFIHTVIIIFCMSRLSLPLTVIPVISMGICGVLAFLLEKKLDKVYEDISEENAVLNTTAEENIGGVRTVKAFAREKHEIEKFKKHNEKYCELSIKETETFVKYYPYFQFISRILPFLILFGGGYMYLKGKMTLGEVSAFVAYSQNIVWPMEMLGWLTNSFASAIASYKKINKIYEEASKIVEPENPVALPVVHGDIRFENVSFHKEDMHEILSDISFEVKSGKTLGIMGATGAGKTSVVSLLTRLYDATSGRICLDGVDIKDLSLGTLRGSISLIMQDVFLFSDTISENIRMGDKPHISDKVIREASRKACADDFIEKMDDEYETIIGERGVGLSGGQKQRISIARALAKKHPILIMDDSTSALDMETERKIQETLSELKDTTKIIIAHRISAVKDADEIIILNEGRIAERGTHDELLLKKGLYYETYVSQYGEPELELRKEA